MESLLHRGTSRRARRAAVPPPRGAARVRTDDARTAARYHPKREFPRAIAGAPGAGAIAGAPGVGAIAAAALLALASCARPAPRAEDAGAEHAPAPADPAANDAAVDARTGASSPADDGPAALFDGRTLAGWTERGGRYDGDADWTVEDGAITGREGAHGEGGLLYTERSYAGFDLALDVRIERPLDSGVFLRMAPDARGVQLTLDAREDGELGGVYSDGWLAHAEHGWERWREGGWNHLEVRARGPDERAFLDLEVDLDGAPLARHRMPPNAVGFAPEGRIGLQVHGGGGAGTGKVQFKDLVLREVAPAGASEPFVRGDDGTLALTSLGWRDGWRPLFDGRSLEGWELHGEPGGITVEDGAIVIASGPGGELATREDYRDFELGLEFATSELANSGVFLRAARDGSNPAYSGCEVQVLDDANWERATGTKLEPWQYTGSLYGAVPPATRAALKPVGEWNAYRIRYVGSRLSVELNGVKLVDVDVSTLDAKPPFSDRARTGFLGLQRHGAAGEAGSSKVKYRNLYVRRVG